MHSCEKYLDVKRTNTQVPIKSTQDLQLLLDNMTLNLGLSNDGTLSADDYYVDNNIYISQDVTNEDRDFYTWNNAAIRNSSSSWQHTYFIIYTANLIIENSDKFRKNKSEDIQKLDILKGSALFYRAWGHWNLAQLYAKTYAAGTASQDIGIPLKMSSDINEKIVRSNVKETYDQVLRDLQEATSLLPNTVVIATRPSKAAAYAMLARVYLSMEEYKSALENATASLQINNQLLDFNTLSKTDAAPFVRYNKEVLFHSISSSSLLLEPGTADAPIAKIDPGLAASYEANDLRKVLYIKANIGPLHVGTFRFSGNYDGSVSSSLFNGIAIDEVYLIRAECYARAGNIVSGQADLNTLLKSRWINGTYINISIDNADQLLSKILTERRKELLMRGLRWSDLRRLNRDNRFAKTLVRTAQSITYTLPANDNRYVLLIPTEVIQNNNVTQNFR